MSQLMKNLQRDFATIQEMANYIEENQPNHKINVRGMVTDASIRNWGQNNAKVRYTFNLTDATGSVPVTIWEIEEKKWNTLYANGNIIEIKSVTPGIYLEKAQLNVDKDMVVNVLDKEEVDMRLYKLSLIPDIDELMNRFKEVVRDIPNTPENQDYLNVFKYVLKQDWFKSFIEHPAAARFHHADRGGLLFHTVTMMERAASYQCPFPINRPLLITGAFLHDLGKIWELEVEEDGSGKYTDLGVLLGHIFIGANLVQNMYRDGAIEKEAATLLTHMVLSHHGTLEFGSPVVPAFLEAGLLHDLDKEDARIFQYQAAYATINPGEISKARIFPLGTNVYRPLFAAVPDAEKAKPLSKQEKVVKEEKDSSPDESQSDKKTTKPKEDTKLTEKQEPSKQEEALPEQEDMSETEAQIVEAPVVEAPAVEEPKTPKRRVAKVSSSAVAKKPRTTRKKVSEPVVKKADEPTEKAAEKDEEKKGGSTAEKTEPQRSVLAKMVKKIKEVAVEEEIEPVKFTKVN